MYRSLTNRKWLTPLLASYLLLLPSIAQADVRILTEVQRDSNGEQATQKYELLVKDQRARRINPDGTITLFDRKANKIYTLLPASKTYFIQDPKQVAAGPRLPDEMSEMLRVKTDIKINDEKDSTKTDANIAMLSSITSTPSTIVGMFKIEPRGGMGGPPRGGQGQMPRFPEGKLSGEMLATDAAKLFGTREKDAREFSLLLITQALPAGNPFAKPLQNQMGKKKIAPVYLSLTVTLPDVTKSPDITQSPGDAESEQKPVPMNTTLRVVRVDTTEVFDEALFVVPSDYQKVKQPAEFAQR